MTESHVLPPDQGESMEAGRPYTKFVRRLESILALSDQDVRLLSEMPTTVRSYRSDQDIVREADMPSQCCLLLDGFLYRHKIANGSTRQIMSFHVPGDIPDLHSLHLDRMDHNLTSLGPTVVAFIPHAYFREILPRSQQLTHALWRETLVDAAVFREWVVNVGAREAIARVAHLLCEIKLRLQVVGLVRDSTFTLPCRQTLRTLVGSRPYTPTGSSRSFAPKASSNGRARRSPFFGGTSLQESVIFRPSTSISVKKNESIRSVNAVNNSSEQYLPCSHNGG